MCRITLPNTAITINNSFADKFGSSFENGSRWVLPTHIKCWPQNWDLLFSVWCIWMEICLSFAAFQIGFFSRKTTQTRLYIKMRKLYIFNPCKKWNVVHSADKIELSQVEACLKCSIERYFKIFISNLSAF